FDVAAEAIARYQPRDIAVVLDFSGSMNDDSELKSITDQDSRDAILANLQQIYDDLDSPEYGDMQFEPVYISSTDNETIKEQLGLVTVTQVEGTGWSWVRGRGWVWGPVTQTVRTEIEYPYPSGSWDDYINYVKSSYGAPANAGYQKKYGYLTLINYWLEKKDNYDQTPDLWKVSAQPVKAVKDAVSVFMNYIQEVDCDDRAALVIYNSPSAAAKLESGLTENLSIIQDLVQHRQAAHYHDTTNIGAGIREGYLELDSNARVGAKKVIVLMTDGQANEPGGTTNAKQYALQQAAAAAERGYQIVTISLGNGADTDLMRDIAELTNGAHYNIPGGSSLNDYEDELLAVFRRIADDRPLLLVK
ncbi:MAG: VWA domain-containing protein, partial [Pirellulales bacterium]|nr:VWA domain-containing protein [Pirellulales bacterium]